MSHLLRVDRIVLSVRADKSDVDHAVRVVDLHHEPVVVALDVEHHAVVTNDARAAVLRLDLGRSLPVLLFDFPVPRKKGFLRVRISLPELPERLFSDDPHAKAYIDPICTASILLPKRI